MKETGLIKASLIRPAAQYYYFRYICLWLIALVFYIVVVPMATHAATSISQGYLTNDSLAIGSVVSLQNNTSDTVVATTTSNVDATLGVVVNNGSSPLTLSNGGAQVQIATSGTVPVLVSDINGEISQGDQITASPIKSVGMKATSNVKVVGIAQGKPINGSNDQQTYTDSQGKKHPLTLGQVPILVNVSYFYKQPEKTVIPPALQNVANALAGKTVNTLPIIISVGIFLITLVVVASTVYTMIRSSIISVGRNPMSQAAVYRNVIQLSALVLGILAAALISIYLILTRF